MNDDLTHLEKVLLDGLKADAGRKSCEYPRVALYIVQAMMLRSMRAAEQADEMPIGRAAVNPPPQPQPPVAAASRRYAMMTGIGTDSYLRNAVHGIVAFIELRTWTDSAIHAIIDLRVNETFDCVINGAPTRITRLV